MILNSSFKHLPLNIPTLDPESFFSLPGQLDGFAELDNEPGGLGALAQHVLVLAAADEVPGVLHVPAVLH